jgi:hypothetical protein
MPTLEVVELNPHAPRPFVFTEPALCLCGALRQAGWAAPHQINEAASSAVAVVLGAGPALVQFLSGRDPRRTVVFNLEQLGSGAALAHAAYQRQLGDWVVADYNPANVAYLKALHGADAPVFEWPLLPDPALRFLRETAPQKLVDVLFYGTLNERRQLVLNRLQAAGLTVEVVNGAYAWELAPALQRARLVLNVHFYETRLFPVTRLLQPFANGVPVVCETSVLPGYGDWWSSGIVFADYEDLTVACLALLASPPRLQVAALQGQRVGEGVDLLGSLRPLLAALDDMPAPRPVPRLPGHASPQEIEAILAAEATQLPPEAHLPAPPIPLAQREPGQGRWGRLGVLAMLLFVALSLWQLRR